MDSISDNDSKDSVVSSYGTICDIIKPVLKDTKIPYIVKKEAQDISHALEGEVSTNVPKLHELPNLAVQTSRVSVFNQVSMVTMADEKNQGFCTETSHEICM